MKESLQIPVLFITFNRPDVSKVVLDRILEVNPPKIYFFNDAPRPGNENDRIKCAEVRDLAKNLNYKGELITRFEEKNLNDKLTTHLKKIPTANYQLNIFDGLAEDLKRIKEILEHVDINSLTPVEALMKLNELKGIVRTNG